MTSRKAFHPAAGMSCLLALCVTAAPAGAQDATESHDAGSEAAVTLPAVTVTGYGTEQQLQDTAGSISVIETDTIEKTNATQLSDLNSRVPGLSAVKANTGGDIRLFIRGIGDMYDERNRRVGVIVDGVPQFSSFLQNPSMSTDIERVEVLKGSQSVLYGQNARGGVINVITKKPTKTGGTAQLGFGNENYVNAFLKYDHIVNEAASLGLVAQWDKSDGFITNVADDKTLADHDRKDFALKASLMPSDKTLIDVRLFANRTEEGGPLLVAIDPDTLDPLSYYIPATSTTPAMKGSRLPFYKVDNNLDGHTKSDSYGLNFNLMHEFNTDLTLNWTAGWSNNDTKRVVDGDGSSQTTFAHLYDDSESTEIFQEVRLNGRGKTFDWIAGLTAYRNQIDRDQYRPLLGAAGTVSSEQTFEGGGAFGQVTWHAMEQLDLTGGARYQVDKAELDSIAGNRSKSENTTTWRGVATWHFNEKAQIYGSIATGYTPGGFNQSLMMDYYEKETSITEEAGFKGLWLNDRLYTAAAVFNTTTKDLQLIDPQTYLTDNLGKVRVRGFEIETNYALTSSWNAGVAFSKLYSKIKEHTDPASIGNRLPYTPDYNLNVNATYTTDTPIGKLYWRTDVTRAGTIYADYRNEVSQDAYNVVDTAVGVQSGAHQLQLWAKNLFDKEYYSTIYHQDGAFTMGTYAQGRSFGVNYRLSF